MTKNLNGCVPDLPTDHEIGNDWSTDNSQQIVAKFSDQVRYSGKGITAYWADAAQASWLPKGGILRARCR